MPDIRKVRWWATKVGYRVPRGHDIDSDGHLQYCQSCFKVGVKSELKKRLYRVEDSRLVPEVIPAPDADRFRQCYRCGDIVPIYNIKQQSSLVDFVEPTLNPFDDNADKIGFTDTARTSRLARKKAQLSSIKDDDLRRELSQGNTLIDYLEQK